MGRFGDSWGVHNFPCSQSFRLQLWTPMDARFIQYLFHSNDGGTARCNALLVILVFSRLAHWPYLHWPGFPEPSGTDIILLDNAPRALSEIR